MAKGTKKTASRRSESRVKKSNGGKSVKKTTKTTPKKSTTTKKSTPVKTTSSKSTTTRKSTAPKKKSTEIKKNEFRRNRSSGHPTYVYAKQGKELKYIGLTHSEITNNTKNIRLEKNPNPNDDRPAYMRPKAQKDNANNFKSKEVGWKLTSADKKKAVEIISKSKK